MATSNSYLFTENRDQIIRAAGRKIGAWASGETPGAQALQDFSDALNAMVKEWEGRGIHVWTEAEGILIPQPGQVQYQMSPTSTDRVAWVNATTTSTDFNATTLSAAGSTGATTLTLTSISNIAKGDQIGVLLTTGSLFWTTVGTVPASSALGLTLALPAPGAALGAVVYSYTTQVTVKPLRIPNARRFNVASALDTSMTPLSRLDYRALSNKTNTGVMTQWYYDSQRDTGFLYLWPAPIDVTNVLKFTWSRPIQDFVHAGDNPDLPQEWINTLVWGLAVEMAPEYGLPLPYYEMLKSQAAEKLEMISGFDREDTPVYFGVDFSNYR